MIYKPLVIGHRGVPVLCPENTLPGFAKAIELGADGIELDVHLTSDGEIVVMHDEQVDRTTDGTGFVKDYSLAEFRKLNAAAKYPGGFDPQQAPTLSEVFDLVGDRCKMINIEIKYGFVLYPGIEEKLVEFVKDRDMVEKVIFSSFNHYSMVHLKKIAPEFRVGLLYTGALVDPWDYATRIGADALHPNHQTVFPEICAGAHSSGIMVNTWTVNTREDLVRMIRSGADALITNDTALAIQVRAEEA